MFEKRAEFRIKIEDLQPLNKPKINEFFVDHNLQVDDQVVQNTITHLAQMMPHGDGTTEDVKTDDNTYFDLEAEVKNHPDSLFVKCFAIKANETLNLRHLTTH